MPKNPMMKPILHERAIAPKNQNRELFVARPRPLCPLW